MHTCVYVSCVWERDGLTFHAGHQRSHASYENACKNSSSSSHQTVPCHIHIYRVYGFFVSLFPKQIRNCYLQFHCVLVDCHCHCKHTLVVSMHIVIDEAIVMLHRVRLHAYTLSSFFSLPFPLFVVSCFIAEQPRSA